MIYRKSRLLLTLIIITIILRRKKLQCKAKYIIL